MSNSVGKISLDLEVNSDLQGQISKVSSNIAKGLKSNLQGATKGIFNGLENGIKKTTGSINKTVGKSMSNLKKNIQNTLSKFKDIKINSPKISFSKPKDETAASIEKSSKSTRGPPAVNLEQLSAQISNTENVLNNVNERIDQQRTKLAQLKESYNQAFEGARKNKLQEQMLKTEATINRLIGQSDKLGFKLAGLDDKYAAMKAMSSNAAEGTGKLNKSISSISNTTNKASTGGNRLKNVFKGLSNSTKSANNSFRGASNGLSIFMGTMLKWGIIFPIVQRGITAMARGLYNNLMTNQAFANSLAQIKTNLMVAFTPIYYAILPAINALMSALSTITGMIASFTSAIFGTTYKASVGATQGLIDAKDAMGAYGDSAKKTAKELKGILAPFDEINQLQSNSDDGAGGGAGGGSDKPVLAPVDTSPYDAAMQKLADRLKRLMEPILNAWEKEGQNTINAIKYALSSVWELIKSIGRSFEEVWLNGTGEETCTLILQILQNIFNIIGDIATAFNNAWNNDNIGTKIVQRLWNSFNNLLYIIKGIGTVLRNVFENIGQSVVDHFMKVLYSLSGLIEKVTNNLRWIWDNGGSYCFGKLIEFGGRVFNILADIVNNSLVPIASFIADILAPVINALLDVIGWVFDKINSFLSWLDGEGNGILTGVVDTLLTFGGAWLVVSEGIKIFTALQGVMALVQSAAGLLSAAIAFLVSPMGLVTVAIGAVILIGYQLYKHWDELSAKAKEVWDSIKNKFNEFKDWLGNIFATDWAQKFGFFGEIANSFLHVISSVWSSIKQVFSGIIDFIAGVFTGNWSRAWQGVVNIFGGIMSGLGAVIKAPLNAVIGIINGAISGINSIHVDIPDWVPGLGGRSFGPHLSRIPYLAKGGIVDQPTLAMVGEAGKEAVMPLENNTGWISNLAGQIASQLPQGGSAGSRQPLHINIYQNGVLTVTKVIDDINDMTRANGGVCPINI